MVRNVTELEKRRHFPPTQTSSNVRVMLMFLFCFILGRFWEASREMRLMSCMWRLHTSKCSSSSARTGLIANAIFGFEAFSLYPKVALIAKCPALCFIHQQQSATATVITAFPPTSFIAVGENTLLRPKGKSATLPFRHMARKRKKKKKLNNQ